MLPLHYAARASLNESRHRGKWDGMVFAVQKLRPDYDCELLQMAASQFSEIVNSIFLPSHDCYCHALCVL